MCEEYTEHESAKRHDRMLWGHDSGNIQCVVNTSHYFDFYHLFRTLSGVVPFSDVFPGCAVLKYSIVNV